MNRQKLLFLTLFSLQAALLPAQDAEKNILGLNLGAGYLSRQDLIFSPFMHNDFSFPVIRLEYTKKGYLFHNLQAGYSGYTPSVVNSYNYLENGKEKISAPHSFTFIDLDYLIGKELAFNTGTFTAGVTIMNNIQVLNYVYGRTGNFGYHATLGAGIFGKYDHSIGLKSMVSVTLKLPAASWFARSPYLVNDDEYIDNIRSHSGLRTFTSFIADGSLATWNKLQYFDLDLTYSFDLTDHWGIGPSYSLEFIHAAEPRSLLSFRNSIFISVHTKF
jgi:hypothetical protein